MAGRRTKSTQTKSGNCGTPPKESLRTLRLVLDHQETAVILVSRDFQIEYLNAAAQSLLNTSAQFAQQTHVTELFTDPAMPLTQWELSLQDEVPLANRSASLILKDGSSLLADYRITPILDLDAALVELHEMNRLMRIGRDDQSMNAQETSRQLVRGLAHEVKNPLGGIRGAAQLLQKELEKELEKEPDKELEKNELEKIEPNKPLANQTPGNETLNTAPTSNRLNSNPLSEYTEVIIREADRLGNLVDRMLGPNQAVELVPTNIHKVLLHVSSLITAESKSELPLELRNDFDPSLPNLAADYDSLVQALLNIMRNAVQALAKTDKPTIRLSTRSVRQFTIGTVRHRLVLRVDIEDNGPGIPPEIYDRIFYPMISGRPEGTGLGLAITQTIISQHMGLLEVESRPGQTCFSVYLPMDIQ